MMQKPCAGRRLMPSERTRGAGNRSLSVLIDSGSGYLTPPLLSAKSSAA
jgi:hypothetical protein